VADVKLTFDGNPVGAVQAEKRVEEALEDLSRQAIQTRATLGTVLSGFDEKDVDRINKRLDLMAFSLGQSTSKTKLFREAITLIKLPALAAGFGLVTQALGALAAGAVALISALAPLSGLLVAIPAAIGGLIQIGGTFALAFKGVGDAIKATGEAAEYTGGAAGRSAAIQEAAQGRVARAQAVVEAAQENLSKSQDRLTAAQERADKASVKLEAAQQRLRKAQEQLKDAQDRLRDSKEKLSDAQDRVVVAAEKEQRADEAVQTAKENLTRAQERALDAQTRLTDARRAAADQLERLREGSEDAAVAEERAEIRLIEARQRLQELEREGTASALDLRKARLDIVEAEDALGDAQRDRAKGAEELIDAEKRGVEGSKDVVAANRGVRDANKEVSDAQKGVVDATVAQAKAHAESEAAQRAVVVATSNVAKAQAGVSLALVKVIEAQDKQRDAAKANTAANKLVAEAQRGVEAAEKRVEAATKASEAAQKALTAAMEKQAPALAKARDAMEKLSPSARDFVGVINGMRPQIEALQRTAAEGLFPGLNEGLRAAATDANWNVLNRIVGDTAKALGDTFRNIGKDLGSAAWTRDLGTIGDTNTKVVRNLGEAFRNLLPAIRDIIVAAGPFLEWLSKGVEGFSEWAKNAASAGRESGKLGGFFEKTKETMRLLWEVLKPLGITFLEIGKAAAPLGREILRDLANEADRLAKWAQSEGGRETMKKYFQNAKPIIYEIGRLVRDISGGLLRLSAMDAGTKGTGLLGFLTRVRTEVLPIFESLTKGAATNFGPTLERTLIELLKLLGQLGGSSGPLIVFVRTIGDFAEAANWLLKNVPGLKEFFILWAGFVGVSRAMNFVRLTQGLTSLGGGLLKLRGGTSQVIQGLDRTQAVALVARGEMTSFGAASAIAGGKMGILGRGFTALGIAFRANPIGVIITALQIAIPLIILLWQNSETFRNIVKGAFEVVKAVVEAAIIPIKAIVEAFKALVTFDFGAIGRALGGIVDAITGLAGKALDAAKKVGAAILDGLIWYLKNLTLIGLIVTHLDDIKNLAGRALDAAKAVGSAILDGLVFFLKNLTLIGFITSHLDGIRNLAGRALDAAKAVGSALLDGLIFYLKYLNIVGLIVTHFDFIRGLAGRALDAAKAVGSAIVDGLLFFLKNLTIIGLIVTHLDAIRNLAGRALDAAKAIGSAIVEGIMFFLRNLNPVGLIITHLDGIRALAGRALSAALDVGRAILSGITSGFATIGSFFAGLGTTIVNALRNILGSIGTAARNIGNGIRTGITNGITGVGAFVVSTLRGLVTNIINWAGSALGAGGRVGTAIKNGIIQGITGVGAALANVFRGLVNVGGVVLSWLGNALAAGFRFGAAIKNGVSQGIAGLGKAIFAVIKGAVNAAIGGINYLIRRINSALQGSFDTHIPGIGRISFDMPDIPQIPLLLAKGGIVTGPTLAVLGDNPSRREAVVPLPERGDLLGGVTVHQTVQGHVFTDRQLLDFLIDGLEQRHRQGRPLRLAR
jgi:phage-related protein